MNNIWIIIILVFILVGLSAFAQYNFKSCAGNFVSVNFVIGIIIYIIMAFVLTILLNYGDIGIINVWWSVIMIIVAFIIGNVFFNEKINGIQIFGVILIFISLFLISSFK